MRPGDKVIYSYSGRTPLTIAGKKVPAPCVDVEGTFVEFVGTATAHVDFPKSGRLVRQRVQRSKLRMNGTT